MTSVDNTDHQPLMSHSFWGWLWVLLSVFVLYVFTLAPDLVWQDQGDYQVKVAQMNLNRPNDVVRVHPLYIVLAHGVGQLGFFSYAYAANLVNAFFTAVCLANVFWIIFALVGRRWPAILAVGLLAFSHTTWFIGVQAQSYGLSNATMTGGYVLLILYLIKGKPLYLYWMGLVFGLGLSVHLMSQIGFFIIFVWLFIQFLKKRCQLQTLFFVLVFWVIGAGMLWVAMVIEYQRSGDFWGTISSAIVGRWSDAVFNIERIFVLFKRSVQFLILNFPTPLLFLAIPGFVFSQRGLHKSVHHLLLWSVILYSLFAVRYDVNNQNHFFLPMYILLTIYIGLGFHKILQRGFKLWLSISVIFVLLMIPTYPALASLAQEKQLSLGTKRSIPYRNVYEYYLIPWQYDQTGPRRLVNDVCDKLPENSILLADSTILPVFKYALGIEKQRQDIQLFKVTAEKELVNLNQQAGKRLFVFSNVSGYYPSWVLSPEQLVPFQISPSEVIYEIMLPTSITDEKIKD